MIENKHIEKLVKEQIEGTSLFLIEVKVDSRNTITIFVDSPEGVTIDQCVEISRHVEHSLDRESEDFSLEVSSPGIGQVFKVHQQYIKALGRTVSVITGDGRRLDGVLKQVNEDKIELEYTVKEKPEGAKRPVMVTKQVIIGFDQIKSTKELITF